MNGIREISAVFLSTTGSLSLTFRTLADGKQFAVISTEIVVPVEELASTLELIDAKLATPKATPSP